MKHAEGGLNANEAEWTTALNNLEAGLKRVREALNINEVVLLEWQVPPSLGSLPESLAARAATLLAQLSETQRTIEGLHNAIGHELVEMDDSSAHPGRAARRSPHVAADVPPPRLIDHSA